MANEVETVEVSSLEEGIKLAIADGAQRIGYISTEDFECYSFEKSVPAEPPIQTLPQTWLLPWSLRRVKGEGWKLDRTKLIGTGGSVEINPQQPGFAVGVAFCMEMQEQIKQGKITVFPSSEARAEYSAQWSKQFAAEWYSGISNQLLTGFTQDVNLIHERIDRSNLR
jgi:hypothetical protein